MASGCGHLVAGTLAVVAGHFLEEHVTWIKFSEPSEFLEFSDTLNFFLDFENALDFVSSMLEALGNQHHMSWLAPN